MKPSKARTGALPCVKVSTLLDTWLSSWSQAWDSDTGSLHEAMGYQQYVGTIENCSNKTIKHCFLTNSSIKHFSPNRHGYGRAHMPITYSRSPKSRQSAASASPTQVQQPKRHNPRIFRRPSRRAKWGCFCKVSPQSHQQFKTSEDYN